MLFNRFLLWSFLSTGFISFSQMDTSYTHNRNRAALYSAILPGAGSIYNEFGHRKVQGRKNISWWRAPLYWAGLGFTGYLSVYNAKEASLFKKEWLYRQDKEEGVFLYSRFNGISDLTLTTNFDDATKYRDYSIAGFFLIYGINLLDAYTDAHFVTFDVSEDLSLNLAPKFFKSNDFGCSLVLNFK
ncbi:hypothetical protein DNU06_08515 [Putridiphycobacter roseus]|uniref:DUF5683 domain-containing protein n=1 Tax=Putridiphycobacter roseus TaxID=2219161 RepID=A0A2W1N0M3_9FLAO|nr:DUF5683 domain-containing protein [Putridiphycobacter roseus]PZE17304.1 hypothetical protein DNU06_08515 [Putridiphycobacter roseus]